MSVANSPPLRSQKKTRDAIVRHRTRVHMTMTGMMPGAGGGSAVRDGAGGSDDTGSAANILSRFYNCKD